MLFATAQNITTQALDSKATVNDRFGIAKIYPTKENGREWYLNMNNPYNDSLLSITFNPNITRQVDGSWCISETDSDYSNPQIRINVDTPSEIEPWRDIEMTEYIKIVSINPSFPNVTNSANSMRNSSIYGAKSPSADESEIEDIAWYARGGKRNEEIPGEGTAYFGGLYPDGTVSWKKSIWWTGGYTEERFNQKVVGRDLTDKWIGWKVIMYNFEANNSTVVKMESYLMMETGQRLLIL